MRRFAVLLVVLAAACGGGGDKQSDAGIDSPIADPDAPVNTGPVKLTITSNGTPMTGVRVHFQAPDSTLISSADTDANGVASALMPNGGYVTAVNPYAGAQGLNTSYLKTIAGVKPGDDLKMSETFESGGHSVTITAPLITNNANIVAYDFWTPCNSTRVSAGSGSGSAIVGTLDVGDSCSTTDVLVTAVNDENDVLDFIYAPNTTTTAAVDLSASTYAAPTAKMFTINNIPVAQGGATFNQVLASAKGALYNHASGGSGTSGGGTYMLPAFPNALSIAVVSADGPKGEHVLVDWGALTSSVTVDLGARLLVPATVGATFDNATRTLSWTESTGVSPDFARADLYITHTTPSPFGIDWEITVPYTAGTVTYPTLPVETIDYNIGTTDPVEIDGVTLGKVPGGYDAARSVLFTLEDAESIVGGASGSATFEFIYAENQFLRKTKGAH